ncbi:MAG: hypothetical protein HXY40_18690 [Chloroflexi bacterium]|nr:hypothetical protein [Chloroflexota bacterium]
MSNAPETVVIPARGRRLRNLTLGFGVLLLLWLAVEDFFALSVALYGAGLAALIAAHSVLRQLGGKTLAARYLLPGAALLGAAWGLGAALATALLMFFKTAMHAHVFPDFPPGQILALLARAPAWLLAGALAGVGLALLWRAKQRSAV